MTLALPRSAPPLQRTRPPRSVRSAAWSAVTSSAPPRPWRRWWRCCSSVLPAGLSPVPRALLVAAFGALGAAGGAGRCAPRGAARRGMIAVLARRARVAIVALATVLLELGRQRAGHRLSSACWPAPWARCRGLRAVRRRLAALSGAGRGRAGCAQYCRLDQRGRPPLHPGRPAAARADPPVAWCWRRAWPAAWSCRACVSRYVQARAREREQRFRGLLAHRRRLLLGDRRARTGCRLTVGRHASGGSGERDGARGIGQVPWELPELRARRRRRSTRYRADLEARQPFRDLPVRWRTRAERSPHHFIVSGEPRFDARGVSSATGAWRATSRAEVAGAPGAARPPSALPASCSRARRRRWCCTATASVLDANAAALALFGFADLDVDDRRRPARRPTTGGDSRERARRAHGRCSSRCRSARRCRSPSSACASRAAGASWRRPPACASTPRRPGDAVDLRRRHRAPARRRRGAPLGGAAVAPGGDQPRRDHADRPADRPLRDGQRDLRAPDRLQRRRGGRPHRARARHLARPRGPRALRRRRSATTARCRTCPPNSSTKCGARAVDAGVGRALRRWTGATTW